MSEPTGSEGRPDLDAAEDFAQTIGVDPTQEEIEHYRQLEGESAVADETVPGAAELADPSVN